MLDDDKTKAIFGFQNISVHPYSIKVNGIKHKAVIDDWQISFLESHEWKRLIPYGGFKWLRMDYIHWVDSERNRIKSEFLRVLAWWLGRMLL